MIKKKFKSTVLCCAFHPTNGQLLATGCSDFKCRVYSTFSADVDGTTVNPGPFGSPLEFGEAYIELNALGWVNAVAWSPSGASLAFASHDSTLHIATFPASGTVVQSIRYRDLPLNNLLFISERAVVAGGHDFNPMVFTGTQPTNWSFFGYLDKKKQAAETAASDSGVAAARQLFQNKTARWVSSCHANTHRIFLCLF
jgi:actin related protein 2/3 complex, subunit 1A/1B